VEVTVPQLIIADANMVRRKLTPERCLAAVRQAMIAHDTKKVAMPPRLIAPLIDKSGFLGLMPGSAIEPPIYGAKVVSLHPANPSNGLPTIQGVIVLFDHASGSPIAIVDGAEVTTLRTAAASALATDLLANPTARSHGILGTGVQAASHAHAILSVRPDIEVIRIWGRNTDHTRSIVTELKQQFESVEVIATTAPEAAGCDIVSVVTGATAPILEGNWLNEGAHVNLVGAHNAAHREADTAAIMRADVYVDSAENALLQAGDLLIPINEGTWSADQIVGEIGALARGRLTGRQTPQQITLYKSLGIVPQDLFAAWAVLQAMIEDHDESTSAMFE
jgi:ornithine cyclodeaminase/alanine dehydrogenase-like protein (mu-crystallin family)